MEDEDHAPYAALYLDNVARNDPLQTKVEYIGRHFDDVHAGKLAEALVANTHVSHLILKANRVTDEGLRLFCNALEVNTAVVHLNLDDNKISDDGCRALLDCLRRRNHSLTEVSLAGNPVSGPLVAELLDVCHLNTHPVALKEAVLQLRDNSVRDLDLSGAPGLKPYTLRSTQLLAQALKINTSLRTLNFSKNNVGDDKTATLAEALAWNSTLVELHLRTNLITCTGAIALSKSVLHNHALQELDLSDNKISDAGTEAFVTCLQTNTALAQMDLRLNNVGQAPLERLVQLLELNAQVPELKKVLPLVSANDPSVRRLRFGDVRADTPLRISDMACRLMLSALCINSYVDLLDLSNQHIHDEGAVYLADLLKLNKTIRSVHLRNNLIGDEGGEALLRAVEAYGTLQELEVTGNPMDPRIMRAIQQAVTLNTEPWMLKAKAPLLLSNDPSVVLFEFDDASECTDRTIDLLLELGQTNTNLRDLNLARCAKVSPTGFERLAQALGGDHYSGLTSLDMSGNPLGDEGAAHFATMLASCPSLLQLLLQDTGMTTALNFVHVLRHNNHHLTSLDLSGNRIVAAELQDIDLLTRLNAQPRHFKTAVLDLFANAPTLKELNLCEFAAAGQSQYRYGKRYNDSSVQLLCEALVHNTTLTFLNLEGNAVTDKGAEYLADLLPRTFTLKTLNLNYNQIGDEGFRKLARALHSNSSISMVSCEGNSIHPETRQLLNQAVHSAATHTGGLRYDALPDEDQCAALDLQKRIEDQILEDAMSDSRFFASRTRMLMGDIATLASL